MRASLQPGYRWSLRRRRSWSRSRRRSWSLRRRRSWSRSRRRRRLARTATAFAVLVALAVWLAVGGGGNVVAQQVVAVHVVLPHETTARPEGVATSAPEIAWPTSGQAAVVVPAIGYRAQSGAERAVPIASLTKIMTAYVILGDHPLAVGEEGPRIRISAADAADFATDTVTDQASVQLQAGEVLTEYQLLEGLLVHSANDFAYALATWDAGSVPAFVAKMNAEASALGMRRTHYADASGYDAGSVSTAADLLRVAAAAMSDPVFAQIVSMPSVTLPLAGSVGSFTPLLTTPGVVGVKSGFTSAAGGGDVLAYRARTGSETFLVLAAVTSQQGPTVLLAAGHEALSIAQAAAARAGVATVAPAGTVVARVRAGIGSAARTVEVRTASAAEVVAAPGQEVRQAVDIRTPRARVPAGTVVGTATFESDGQVVSVAVRAASAVPAAGS